MPVEITYGPPGVRGVTQLMAVGADDFESSKAEQATMWGGFAAVGVWAYAQATKNKQVGHVAFGAAVAFFALGLIHRNK